MNLNGAHNLNVEERAKHCLTAVNADLLVMLVLLTFLLLKTAGMLLM